ncbi:50S ribosomal protein L9 [Helicobacter cappadocius]|uniref:Large ribosomal subunit protein bL9 n=1 Tax=Helicobacter cappadocius TaxID=3063998 RepID=A0AA90TA95_9HELI|nr:MULTISPECIES: 50S ribosomal protein L9 [unclassified Helicobacter]MDO7253818.1 50S ribosomal protein L9 [Helicobacter sp. faydin-H75]MDP2539707.1 50S ribosomal protein L9 [Helicobacter sp. faydin-H76]
MKILLMEDVKGLGKTGEIHEVKDGYGQNFLIAKGKAKHATNEVINKYKADQKKKEELQALQMAERKQLATSLNELTLNITRKVGANGSLFGAITKEEIAEALEKSHRISLDKKDIELKSPIKSTGIYEIEAKLGYGISGIFKIDVMAE